MTGTAWPEVPLGEVAEVRLGRQRSPKNHSGPMMRPYIRAANVGWSGLLLDDVKSMNFTDDEMMTYALRPGDLLLNEASGSRREVGKPAIWNGEIEGCAFQNTLIRVRPKGPEPRYLLHYFRYQAESGALAAVSRGVGIHHLGREALASWSVPLPPIEEQRRIAAVLDKADELRAKRRAAVALLDSLTESIFLDMFGDSAVTAHPVAPLNELIDEARPICYGILKPGPDLPDGAPYVRVVDMKEGAIDHASVRRTTPEISHQFRRSLLRTGDLLMSIRGHVGRLAEVPPQLDGANITQDSARIGIVGANPRYVLTYLRTSAPQRWMERNTKGVAVRGLNIGDLRRLPVLVPPASLQDQFVERAMGVEAERTAMRASLNSADALFASLQQRALRGEL